MCIIIILHFPAVFCATGIIPEGIGELKELEVLDLGYNNFTGLVPAELGSNLSLTIL